jgi:hypothetical protein
MRHVEELSEHEMVATFLKAEVASTRFRKNILALLHRDHRDRSVIDQPDTTNKKENAYRARLLGKFRGYRQNRNLFASFPRRIAWHRYALSKGELNKVKYISDAYWYRLSSGSRLPGEAAKNVRAGQKIFGRSTRWHLDFACALEGGAQFPELILVGTGPDSQLVLLEGHGRLTAYSLVPTRTPKELSVIIGFSRNMSRWVFF